jgi:DNA-binding CsgD family transcriptional regulator
MSKSDHLPRGRARFARRAWADAYESFTLADESAPLDIEDLERLASAAALIGRGDAMLAALERVYQASVDDGDVVRAARAAFWSGFRLFGMGEHGRASGWLARAQRLVESYEKACVIEGFLLLPVIHRHLASREYDAADEVAARAGEIGERFRDPDLIAFARNLQGRALIRKGRIARGLALMDEAMLAAARGELSPIVTGLVYCNVIVGYQQVYALDRAREWTSALASWCNSQPQLVAFTGTCLVHRAEIMQLGGDWPEAIEEARRAATKVRSAFGGGADGDAHYQQAEIHRLRGEYAAAEEVYRKASERGREPQPGLALLRLAQGQKDAAATAIRRVVGAASDPLQRIRLLPAYVEILLAVGDVADARRGARELEEIAARFDTEVLQAMAAHAVGAVRLAEGDASGAIEPLRRAFRIWQGVGAPYIAARIRVELGSACRTLADDDGTRLELDAARAVFQKLGADPDIAALAALEKERAPGRATSASTRSSPAAAAHGLTARELQVLRLVAAGKTNKAIARELSLSEKTVDRHVSNIFTKIDVASRAAATAYAYQHDLV